MLGGAGSSYEMGGKRLSLLKNAQQFNTSDVFLPQKAGGLSLKKKKTEEFSASCSEVPYVTGWGTLTSLVTTLSEIMSPGSDCPHLN